MPEKKDPNVNPTFVDDHRHSAEITKLGKTVGAVCQKNGWTMVLCIMKKAADGTPFGETFATGQDMQLVGEAVERINHTYKHESRTIYLPKRGEQYH